jgi:hypothetical protein
VPNGTKINFMRGRFMGLATSAVLSIASVILFLHPGLTSGLISGAASSSRSAPSPADFGQVRAALATQHVEAAGVQSFGAPDDVLIRLDAPRPAAPITRPAPRHWSIWSATRSPPCRARRSCAPMPSAPRSRPNSSATACWRWASAC